MGDKKEDTVMIKFPLFCPKYYYTMFDGIVARLMNFNLFSGKVMQECQFYRQN